MLAAARQVEDASTPMELSPAEIISQSFQLALASHREGRLEEAEQLYRAILAFQPDHADAMHGMGVLAHLAGRDDLAETYLEGALHVRRDPTFFNNLALVRLALGKPNEALASAYRALELRSDYPEAHEALGNIQNVLGQRGEAVASYEKSLAVKPDRATTHANLGKVLFELWEVEKAKAACRKAIELAPDCAEAQNTLGNILRMQGDTEEARACFDRALALRPNFAEAHNNLAVLLLTEKAFDEALRAARCALACDSRLAPAWATLGLILQEQDKFAESIDFSVRAIAIDPAYIAAYNNLGGALLKLDRVDQAIAVYEKAIELSEQGVQSQSYFNLGTEMLRRYGTEKAITHFEKALDIDPNCAPAQNNLGVALQNIGRAGAAIGAYEKSMKINPQYAAAYCNKLMAMQYLDVYGNEDSLATARAFGEAFVVEDGYDFRARDLSPERKLRIGYVSGDFNAHPVAFFTRDAITRHHREAFEIYCYYNCTRDDEWTAQFREAADCWRVVYGKTSAELIEMIRNDAPDILIDLAGHTDKTRVPVFGTRMAPIQAHWVGYTGTIGLSTMDYLILDPISAPPGADRHYAEALTRLPYGRFCYTPLAPDEPLAEPPCLRNGYVTFGCFNNITKVGAGVIAVWAQILKALPDARLILKSKSLIQPSAPAPLLEMFEAAGVSRDRIELRGASSYLDMLREYNDVDIALDPFPFGGATTTCDCLYMGLPVINLPGDRLASRQSVAFLQPMGHAELCADSLDDYVAKAVALAGDPERLIRLRPELRRALLDAPFSDGARFVTGLEKAFRIMWRRFVSGERASPIDIRAEP